MAMSPGRALLKTLRPHQWVKNLFVAAAPFFGKKLVDAGRVDGHNVGVTALAFATFCALSGAVYALNDVVDVEKDRAHPTKCRRPIASGALSERGALIAAGVLAAGALVGATLLAPRFGLVAAAYLIINLAYSFRLKEVAYVDVLSIAAGFLLRVLGGAAALAIAPSPWLLACTTLLAAFLGFGKRAHELAQATQDGGVGKTRAVLTRYRPRELQLALWILGAATSVSYVAYTLSAHTEAFFGARRMVWTAPFCVAGIARFLWLVTHRPQKDSPTDAMLRDIPFVVNLLLWGAVAIGILNYRP